MNAWLWAAFGLIAALIPCAVAVFRGDVSDRVVALESAGLIEILAFLALAQGYHRIPFYDVALTMAFLTFGAGLVFARFLERWL